MESKWTITRESDKRTVFDGVCYLKTIIDHYHVNTRSSAAEVRTKLAQLHLYMRHTAKGDVVQLCVYTRDLLEKLRAAGCEHTRILGALIEHPQGNLEEIQQKTLQSTQEEPVGRRDRKA